MKKFYFAFIMLWFTAACAAETDALAPKTDASGALTSPLNVVTVSTNSLPESLLFYRDAMGMSVHGPVDISDTQKQKQRKLWGLDNNLDWQAYRLYREGVKQTADIQLMVFEQAVPAIHQSWSALELGTFSMGFPNMDQISQDKKVRAYGFGALNEIEIYDIPRTDGTQYPIHETIFNGPDFVHGVGIHRGDGMKQLGEIADNGLGGPAYSALIVKDSQTMIDFFVQVLGWELRSDRQWKSAGTKGALNVPDGTEFRFAILYSQGASRGHVLLLEYLNVDSIDTGVEPRLPNRGIGMWSVATKDLKIVIANAKTFGSKIVKEPISIKHPILGEVNAASLLAPNGLLIEVYQNE